VEGAWLRSQEAAEEALKGFLTWRDIAFGMDSVRLEGNAYKQTQHSVIFSCAPTPGNRATDAGHPPPPAPDRGYAHVLGMAKKDPALSIPLKADTPPAR
jgi:hypothetical protein